MTPTQHADDPDMTFVIHPLPSPFSIGEVLKGELL